jgi:hypothetical protein
MPSFIFIDWHDRAAYRMGRAAAQAAMPGHLCLQQKATAGNSLAFRYGKRMVQQA